MIGYNRQLCSFFLSLSIADDAPPISDLSCADGGVTGLSCCVSERLIIMCVLWCVRFTRSVQFVCRWQSLRRFSFSLFKCSSESAFASRVLHTKERVSAEDVPSLAAFSSGFCYLFLLSKKLPVFLN